MEAPFDRFDAGGKAPGGNVEVIEDLLLEGLWIEFQIPNGMFDRVLETFELCFHRSTPGYVWNHERFWVSIVPLKESENQPTCSDELFLRSRQQEGQGMRILFFLIGLILPIMASGGHSQDLYRWTDETGRVNIVDELGQVPERYRPEIKVYRRSFGKSTRSPAERDETSQPDEEASVKQEQAEPSAPTLEERAARTEALREEKEGLEEEKARLRVLETRYRTRKSRSILYTRRIEQLDKEVEAIQKELDALRQEGK